MSVEERSRRLSSSSFPRLRSQPMKTPCFGFHSPIAVEQVETVVPVGHVPAVERLDPGHRRGQDLVVSGNRERRRVLEVAEDREVDPGVEVAERLHLQVRQEPLDLLDASRGARAPPPSCGRPRGSRRRSRGGGAGAAERDAATMRWTRSMASSLAGSSARRAAAVATPAAPAAPAYAYALKTPKPVRRPMPPRYAAVAWAKAQRRSRCSEARAVRHVDLEAAPARADQVMADVRCLGAASLLLCGPSGDSRRCAGRRAPGPRLSVRRDPPPRGDSGRELVKSIRG